MYDYFFKTHYFNINFNVTKFYFLSVVDGT